MLKGLLNSAFKFNPKIKYNQKLLTVPGAI